MHKPLIKMLVAYDKRVSHRLAESARKEIRYLQRVKPKLKSEFMQKQVDRAIGWNKALIREYKIPTPFLSKEKSWRV